MGIRRIMRRIRKALGRRSDLRRVRPVCDVLEGRQLLASDILFNPTGSASTPVVSIETLDFAAGSALAKNAVPTVVGSTFQLYFQATVVGALDSSGNSVNLPGLNTSYQLTAVSSFTEVVTDVNLAGASVTFALAPTQAADSFFELYYNPSVVANNLAGTGFNQGSRILFGRPSASLPNSSNFALSLVQPSPLPPLDSFDPDNYPGISSVDGLGSSLLGANVVSLDASFFVSPVLQLSFNTNTSTPFDRTNPSGLFVGNSGGAAPTIVPNVGPVNGIVGPDIEFQADSNSTFTLASPAIAAVKATDGVVAPTAPGPVVAVGDPVTWTYDVTSPGNEPLRNVTVVDDAGTPGDPADDFAATFVSGDTNGDGLLDPGETWRFTASGVARAGQYENRAVAAGVGVLSNTPVTATTISHYFAAVVPPPTPAIAVVKLTNGQFAPTPTGPTVFVGSNVTFTYLVSNPGQVPLHNVTLVDDAGTSGLVADDFRPTFVGGDANGNALLDPGETWTYTASRVATLGQYSNIAVATGLSPTTVEVTAVTNSNHFGICPMVVDVTRTGVHLQKTRVVVTFDGPLDPAMAEDVRNYRISSIGPDGRFSRPDRVVSAVYDPTTNSVTLTLEHRLNVHHLSRIRVANPCPGGPAFDGVLNRKFSLGVVTIVGKHGHHFVFPQTNAPKVLKTELLPKVLRPSNRAVANRLSLKPSSSAFAP
jgi:hypothetical protein